ncbi:hypothetical protein EAF04_002492 [Stromatinia cepivora]|nr:hypothetical protein EAF04_002492 [Stromatinia cepivora]
MHWSFRGWCSFWVVFPLPLFTAEKLHQFALTSEVSSKEHIPQKYNGEASGTNGELTPPPSQRKGNHSPQSSGGSLYHLQVLSGAVTRAWNNMPKHAMQVLVLALISVHIKKNPVHLPGQKFIVYYYNEIPYA